MDSLNKLNIIRYKNNTCNVIASPFMREYIKCCTGVSKVTAFMMSVKWDVKSVRLVYACIHEYERIYDALLIRMDRHHLLIVFLSYLHFMPSINKNLYTVSNLMT